MQLYLTARHLELTDALRSHVERHLIRAAEGHGTVKLMRMEVQLYRISSHVPRYGCHVLLVLSHRHEINLREEDRDLYEAIDLAQKRTNRALTEYRDHQLTDGRHPRKYSWERLRRALGWAKSEHRS